jgi:hypothetical protein
MLVVFICACALFFGINPLCAREVETPAKKILSKLLNAVEDNDYNSFVEDGSAEFKAGLTKQMLGGVSQQLSSRMKAGYETYYLGQLKQQGCEVHLWKLVYGDGGDDTLAKLALKDGKVAGFWLQ